MRAGKRLLNEAVRSSLEEGLKLEEKSDDVNPLKGGGDLAEGKP